MNKIHFFLNLVPVVLLPCAIRCYVP